VSRAGLDADGLAVVQGGEKRRGEPVTRGHRSPNGSGLTDRA